MVTAAAKVGTKTSAERLTAGLALERANDQYSAFIQYARALQDEQKENRWINPATTPAQLRPVVEHAVQRVRTGRRALLMKELEASRARYGRDALARVEQCLRIYLREERPEYPDPRQQPSFLYFPGLAPAPYLDRALFPWIGELEAATSSIREELLQLLPSAQGRERVFTNEDLERQNLRGLDAAPSWNGYYFYRHGERRDDNCRACPITTATLEKLPLAHVPEHGPEVLFSVFTPGTHLLPHRGVTNTRLVGHLPLIVPPDCALNVGGKIHEWQVGRVVVFDDTYEHEAWNRSQEIRVVLIFDIWHPGLTAAERAAVTNVVVAAGNLRKAIEAA
jgi:aspartate beta-hydroxylase